MKKTQLETPILLITFKRPDTTKKVFEEIKKVRPKKLFIFSDGPRNEKERHKVKEVRKIFSNINWDCEVKTSFQKENKGMVKGALESINWFFRNVEEGIIFDDDCVPTPDFFRFCSEMLKRYRNDERIMHICGYNFQRGWKRDRYSYYFSKYTYIWGWATWRRAWKKYDFKMKDYPELREKCYFSDIFPNKIERSYINRIMSNAYYKNPNAVDTRWLYSTIINNGLTIVPNKNLVKNIGFGKYSTHTKPIDSYLSMPTQKLKFPLRHPPSMIRDLVSDERYAKWLFKNRLKKYILSKSGLSKFFKK